jgi:glycerol-3-phosphate dehydrogenase (NAD(P)+)
LPELKLNPEERKKRGIKVRPAVIGAGNWGTALANLLGEKEINVKLWAYEQDVAEGINNNRKNPLFLRDVSLSDRIKASNDIKEALEGCDIVIMVTPSHVYRSVLGEVLKHISSSIHIVSATKGIENESLMLMSQITEDLVENSVKKHFAVLSGPTFAKEVAAHYPSAAVIASKDRSFAEEVRDLFSTYYLRLYTNEDIIGVQLGGALKNIIAIANGITEGLGLGLNTQAALITRGNAEMTRLAVRLGADPKTLSGLAGVGDLILTATGNLSRNRTLGVRLGQGEKLADVISSVNTIAEGVKTTSAAYELAKKTDTEMPIVNALYKVLYENKPAGEAVKDLMNRPLKNEFW